MLTRDLAIRRYAPKLPNPAFGRKGRGQSRFRVFVIEHRT